MSIKSQTKKHTPNPALFSRHRTQHLVVDELSGQSQLRSFKYSQGYSLTIPICSWHGSDLRMNFSFKFLTLPNLQLHRIF